jgi:hypothetical protein
MEQPPAAPLTGNQAGQPARSAGQLARDLAQQARDAARQGIPTAAPPAFYPREPTVPKGAVDISVAVLTTVAICVIGAPIARALGRRIDRKSEVTRVADSMAPQLRQLQESVDAMAIEIERISEGQRFTSKLLAERAGAPIAGRSGPA